MTETGFTQSTWCKWIGQRVCIKGINNGTLRYFGEIIFNDGLWCGIELDEPLGETNGIFNNIRYFTCKDNYGIFVPSNEVTKLSYREDETNTELYFTSSITVKSDVNYVASNSTFHNAKYSFQKPCEVIEEFKNTKDSLSNHNSNIDPNKTFDINRLGPRQLYDIAETSLEGLNKYTFDCVNRGKESLFKGNLERGNIDRLDSEESLGIIPDLLNDDMTFDLCKTASVVSNQNLNDIMQDLEDSSELVFSPPNISKMNFFFENDTTPSPCFENEHRYSSTPKISLSNQCNKKGVAIEHNFFQDENRDVEPIIAGYNHIEFKTDFDVEEFKNSCPLTSTSKAFSPQLISSLLSNERFNISSEGENSTLQEVFEMKEERILNVTQTFSDTVDKNKIDCNRNPNKIQNFSNLLNCTFTTKPPVSLKLLPSIPDDSILSHVKNVSSINDGLEKTVALNSTFVLSGGTIKCISDCERTFVINQSPTKAIETNFSLNLVKNLEKDIKNVTFSDKLNCKNNVYNEKDLLQCDNPVIEITTIVHQKQMSNATSENSGSDPIDEIRSAVLPLVNDGNAICYENANVENTSQSGDFSDEMKKQKEATDVMFSENEGQHNSDKITHETIINSTFSKHYDDEILTSCNDDFSNNPRKSIISSTLTKNIVEIQAFDNDSSKKLETQKALTNAGFSKNTNEIISHDYFGANVQKGTTESFAVPDSEIIRTDEETNLSVCADDPFDEIECVKSQKGIRNMFLGSHEKDIKTRKKINSDPIGIVSRNETSLKLSETVTKTYEKAVTDTLYQNGNPCETKSVKLPKASANTLSEKGCNKDKSFSKINSFHLKNDARNKSLAKPTKIVCPKKVTREISRLPAIRSNVCKSKLANNKVSSELNSTFSMSNNNSRSTDSKTKIKRLSLSPSSVKDPNNLRCRNDFKKHLLTSSRNSVNESRSKLTASVIGGKSSVINSNLQNLNVSTTNIQGSSPSLSADLTAGEDIEKATKSAGTITDNNKDLKSTGQSISEVFCTKKAKYSELKSNPKIARNSERHDKIVDNRRIADLPDKNDILAKSTEINETNSKKINKNYSVSNLPCKTLLKTTYGNSNKNCISKPVINQKDMSKPKVGQLGIVKPRYSLPSVQWHAKNTVSENKVNEDTQNKIPSFTNKRSLLSKNLSNEYDVPSVKGGKFLKGQRSTADEKQKENVKTGIRKSTLPLPNDQNSKNANLADIKNKFYGRVSLLPVSEKQKEFSSCIARPNEAQIITNSTSSKIIDSQRIVRKLPQLQKKPNTLSYCKKS
ncbi:uncharacterized protein NPIL_558731 [Nephila pilipes]|uniref:CAP-Gly domain-containing protein n=1 Tax=Nephila pilipes TaxID=299642 RepID=A0A8X6JVI4_NEPPI|nr:uncharacterized protein NPIL_558731 [Nephila pilipes]